MRRALLGPILMLLWLSPTRLVGQQSARLILVRHVGAVHAAALISTLHSPRSPDLLDIGFSLPPSRTRLAPSRRQMIRLTVTKRLEFSTTGDWLPSGVIATVGLGLRF